MSKTAEITAGIFVVMISLRALLSLVLPARHKRIAARFYREGSRVRYFYLVLFFLASALLIREASITGFILALMAIGFLYDYFLSLFPEESGRIVEKGQAEKARLWFFGYAVPFGSLAWFLVSKIPT